MSTEDVMTEAQAVGRALEAYWDLLVCCARALHERQALELSRKAEAKMTGLKEAQATEEGTPASTAASRA